MNFLIAKGKPKQTKNCLAIRIETNPDGKKMLNSELNPSLRSGQATANNLLKRIVAVQVCDATEA